MKARTKSFALRIIQRVESLSPAIVEQEADECADWLEILAESGLLPALATRQLDGRV